MGEQAAAAVSLMVLAAEGQFRGRRLASIWAMSLQFLMHLTKTVNLVTG